jgi:hypothetical protein
VLIALLAHVGKVVCSVWCGGWCAEDEAVLFSGGCPKEEERCRWKKIVVCYQSPTRGTELPPACLTSQNSVHMILSQIAVQQTCDVSTKSHLRCLASNLIANPCARQHVINDAEKKRLDYLPVESEARKPLRQEHCLKTQSSLLCDSPFNMFERLMRVLKPFNWSYFASARRRV